MRPFAKVHAMFFRSLTPAEEANFRSWVRDNYKPGAEIRGSWHPVVHTTSACASNGRRRSSWRSPRRSATFAIVAGSVGLAGLAVGVGAGIAGSSQHSALSGECSTASGSCPSSAQTDLDAFHTWRTFSTVGYVVGAVGVVAVGVLFLTAPSSRGSSGGATKLYVGPASAGLAGVF